MQTELDTHDKVLLQRAMAKLNSANELLTFLAEHFRDKYSLTPQQVITPEGLIKDRAESTNGTLLNAARTEIPY